MGSLRPEVFAAINTYWSEVFGCAPHELWRGGTTIGTHHGPLAGYPGVYVLAARGTTRVSAPDHLVDQLGARLASAGGTLREALLQPDSWREWFGRGVTRIHGPSVHHYLDDPTALADPAVPARAPAGAPAEVPAGGPVELRTLGDADAELLDKFRAACDPAEWAEAGFSDPTQASPTEPAPVYFGAFRDGTLIAAANLTEWRGEPSDVGVLTLAEYRRAGTATRLAALASRYALDAAGIVRYRALVTNRPSLAIARRLGYQEFGRNLVVRLEP